MEGEESIEQFLIHFDDLLRKTKVAGCKIQEEMVACLLLLTLPDSYNVVVTAIETLSGDKISVDFVRKGVYSMKRLKENHAKLNQSHRKTNTTTYWRESIIFFQKLTILI